MALINVLKSTDFVNTAYRPVKNRHFSANIVLCAENVSENEKSGKAEYSYFVPALWHLLLSPPPTPIAHLVLSTADLAFFAPHPVRIFRRTQIDAPRRGRRPRRPVHVSAMSPAGGIFRAPGRGSLLAAAARQPFSLCRRRPYFFQQRKKYGKERRQKPVVFGFPLSDSNHGTKRFRIESLVPPSPLPLPRTARRCAGLLSCSGIVASISAVSRIPAQLDRRTP